MFNGAKDRTPEAIRLLNEYGLRIIMLTGDSRRTAEAVARKLGIDEVIAEVLSGQKSETIKKLQAKGRVVAMAGDGINDARCYGLEFSVGDRKRPAAAAGETLVSAGQGLPGSHTFRQNRP